MTLNDRPPKMRWGRTQRFSLSSRGAAAEAAYREQIVLSRNEAGRASYDAARTAWASAHGLLVDDGLYLAEVASKPVTLVQIIASLETCGKTKLDAITAIGRLVDAGLISAPPP